MAREDGSRPLQVDLGTELVGIVAFREGVERPAQPAALVFQCQRPKGGLLVAAVDGPLAAAHEAVEADPPGLFFAEPKAGVQVQAEVRFADEGGGQAGQRLRAGALADDVDAAADAAVGGHAVDEGGGALHQLQPFDQLGRHAIGRNQAVQAVEADVALAHREAADLIGIGEAAAGGGQVDRRVVDQGVGRGARLLILAEVGGVVDGAERDVHDIRRAELS